MNYLFYSSIYVYGSILSVYVLLPYVLINISLNYK